MAPKAQTESSGTVPNQRYPSHDEHHHPVPAIVLFILWNQPEDSSRFPLTQTPTNNSASRYNSSAKQKLKFQEKGGK